jgi:MFS family permease
MIAASLFGAGLMSFELVAFHLSKTGIVTEHWLPIFLALATVASVIASLILGRLYDQIGIHGAIGAVILAAGFSPLVFLGGFWSALFGLLLWGIGYATQDTLLKVLIASELPEGKRNFAFGVFYLGYGAGWLIGSLVTGLLYEQSRWGLIAFAATVQLSAIPFFLLGAKTSGAKR